MLICPRCRRRLKVHDTTDMLSDGIVFLAVRCSSCEFVLEVIGHDDHSATKNLLCGVAITPLPHERQPIVDGLLA